MMRPVRDELPTGVVTFLFTDVEGSTRMLEELGAVGYAQVNDAHRVVIRAAVAEHCGVEVSTHGDAFFCVFASPADAVRAAAAAQAELEDGPIRVRMGIHLGEAVIADSTYVGMDVNRAARIMDAGHGGQVLVSAPVRALLPDDLVVDDLGEHRLKDLGEPVRLFQVGKGSFRRLRTLPTTNLPVPATPFLGRERELGEVVGLLRDDALRVVTLTGPGGTGKTRLALQAAAEVGDAFPDGVRWVALSALRDAARVLPAIAVEVGLEHEDDSTLRAALTAHLAPRRQLLLLDNVEHLLPGIAPLVADLVAGAPMTRVLMTSRERLRIAGETAYPVPELMHDDAVELFRTRARAAGADPGEEPVVGELCDRLERLPLALELAAARSGLLSPAQLLDRLGQRLDLFRGGRDADPRQATLRATIDWSYELLTPEEQRVYRGLAVFVGGCTADVAEEVLGADLDTLQSLLDKSLVRRRSGRVGERLWMLETVREHARELLDGSADAPAVRATHRGWAVALAGRAGVQLLAADQVEWLARLDDEIDDLRAAFEDAVAAGEAADGVAILRGLSWYFAWRGLGGERTEMLERVLASSDAREPRLAALVMLSDNPSTPPERRRWAQEEAERLAGDDAEPRLVARLLEGRVYNGLTASTDASVAALLEARAIYADVARDDDALTRVAINLAAILAAAGRPGDAAPFAEEAASTARALGNLHKEGLALLNLAETQLALGRRADAASSVDRAMVALDTLGDVVSIGYCFGLAGRLAVEAGDAEVAAHLLGAFEATVERAGETVDPLDAPLLEAAKAAVRERLGEEAADGLLEDGAQLSPEDAVELARATAASVTLDSPDRPARP